MKLIELTQGFVAKVDNEDYENLCQYHWAVTRKTRIYYAKRSSWANKKITPIYMHRQLMEAPIGMQVDHINGDGLDNRKSNLRICTKKQNLGNRKHQANQKNKYKGVQRYGKQWQARIWSEGKTLFIGAYKTEIEAALAWNETALRLRGEFANLNVIHKGIEPDSNVKKED